MKLVFHGQMLNHTNKTGIAWAAHNLILELAKYPENECVIQTFSFLSKKKITDHLKIYEDAGCRIESCRWFSYAGYKILWLLFPIPYRIFFRTKPDVTQFFDFTVPPGVQGPCVTFIHDMAYRACPQTVRLKTKLWLHASLKHTCRHADHIIAVSEFGKKEIVNYLKVQKERISVVPNAVDHTVYHTDYTQTQIRRALKKYGITQSYFLYLGTIEPRKNLEILMDAYALFVRKKERQKKQTPLLVLAGGRGWKCGRIYKKAKELHLEDRIRFTGYIDQTDSPLLMRAAIAFVFPSIYEGFGMPPLEAMACGTPVIVSNTSSLPEVVKDAGIFVDPKSKKQMCRAMERLSEDTAYRKQLEELAVKRAQAFTWQDSAKRLMEIYRKLLAE